MPLRRLPFLAAAVVVVFAVRVFGASEDWHATHWNGEEAVTSTSSGWTATVSIDRARLVWYGRIGGPNLLFSTTKRDDPAGWGGHRMWLGPQGEWPKIWPPPAAWESSRAKSVSLDQHHLLRLELFDAGDGWPKLARTYRWRGSDLVCGAELEGGTRPAQVIQIIQIPGSSKVHVAAFPDAFASRGYVRLPPTNVRELTAEFATPSQVSGTGHLLELHYNGVAEKLGFAPELLEGTIDDRMKIGVVRGPRTGKTVGEPDHGYFSQVFLGSHEPFIELEQLSPLFAPGGTATFEIILRAVPLHGK
ncbi:MAG TPA: hypothetical protein VHD32_13750 [Candidatus Didemnitutus sp.]|nr:hypothetical protein [Candidatus Didemnitutus sp.]